MTQKEKDLLLEDLYSRLNTNLVCSIYRVDDYGVGYRDEILTGYCKGDIWYEFYFGDDCGICIDNVSKIKPYLFPLSSMTEEQRKEFLEISHLENRSFYNGEKEIEIVSNEVWTFDLGGDADTEYRSIDIKRIRETVKWLNKNHFDWRGLIPMGLAEDATNKNIY